MMKKFAIILPLVLASAACAPTIETRGNIISDAKFAKIQPYSSTRAEIQQLWGPPTTYSTLDPNTWYYIGEKTTQAGVFAYEVEKRRMIRVKFDQDDTIIEISDIDTKKGTEVSLVDRKTPTAGKEFTIIQQFVGNIGKFNKPVEATR